MKKIVTPVLIVLFIAFIYFVSFIFPKMERDAYEKKTLEKLAQEQQSIDRKIVFGKNGKLQAVKYICEAPKTLKADPTMNDGFFIVVAGRMAGDYNITKGMLSDYLKKNPGLVELWLAESGKPVGELFSVYFGTYSFYYEDGYYWLKYPEMDMPPLKSAKKYDLCAEYIMLVCGLKDTPENRSIRLSYIDTSFKREKFRIMFREAGYNYIFGITEVQERLFGEVVVE